MSRLRGVAVAATIAGAVASGGLAPVAAASGDARAAAAVRAYVAALRTGDADAACARLDVRLLEATRTCRSLLRSTLRGDHLRGARLEGPVLVRGRAARVVVSGVVRSAVGVRAIRARVLLRRRDDRWLIGAGGPLPGLGYWLNRDRLTDPAPAGTGAALRRVADDALLALSGNEGLLCDVLAPGAPLTEGGCGDFAAPANIQKWGTALRAQRVVVHRSDATHARLTVTVAGTRAKGSTLRTRTWTDTVFAVRVAGRWRLLKPSRGFYRAIDLPAPDDVDAPTPTATWTTTDPPTPSLSERPVPAACRTPPPLWPRGCRPIDGFAVGGGLVVWSIDFAGVARPVSAGAATGAIAALSRPAGDFVLVDVAPVADGALLIEEGLSRGAGRATPLGPDGRPRGPAQVFDTGVANVDDTEDPLVLTDPPGASTATVVTGRGRVLRLGADGRVVGPGPALKDDDVTPYDGLVVRPDGTVLAVARRSEGLVVRPLGADGRITGATVTQPPIVDDSAGDALAAAQAADGRVLAAWTESDTRGRGVLRAWAFDPSAPTATAPTTVATLAADDPLSHDHVEAAATPDGGWGLAWSRRRNHAAGPLWAARLTAAGALAAPPRAIARAVDATDASLDPFGLVGDTVAWVDPPAVAGLPQVRAAPLP